MEKLKLLKNDKKTLVNMPIDDVGILIKKNLPSKIIRKIILTNYFSKFTGFVLKNNFLSFILFYLKITKKINQKINETFKKEKYKNFNQAFIHRYDRELPKEKNKKIFSSPVDAYLNIREIQNLKIKLFDEIILDLERMIGLEYIKYFREGGKMFLFTLKPFHDHTVDHPFNSEVLENPREINLKKKKVFSTDLFFLKFLSKENKLNVFEENHRVITKLKNLESDDIYFLLEVGAINVNSIEQDNCEAKKKYLRGEQKSHFNFGSTVILLLPKKLSEKINFENWLIQKENISVEVKRGEKLGIFNHY